VSSNLTFGTTTRLIAGIVANSPEGRQIADMNAQSFPGWQRQTADAFTAVMEKRS
jgi:hypothetical protein